MEGISLRGKSRGYGLPSTSEARALRSAAQKKAAREAQGKSRSPYNNISQNLIVRLRAAAITAMVREAGLEGLSSLTIGAVLNNKGELALNTFIDRNCSKLYKDHNRWYHMDFDITKQ